MLKSVRAALRSALRTSVQTVLKEAQAAGMSCFLAPVRLETACARLLRQVRTRSFAWKQQDGMACDGEKRGVEWHWVMVETDAE